MLFICMYTFLLKSINPSVFQKGFLGLSGWIGWDLTFCKVYLWGSVICILLEVYFALFLKVLLRVLVKKFKWLGPNLINQDLNESVKGRVWESAFYKWIPPKIVIPSAVKTHCYLIFVDFDFKVLWSPCFLLWIKQCQHF